MATEAKIANEIEEVVKLREEPEQVVLAKAIELGISRLWRETVLEKYLKGKLTKKQAIKMVGSALVNLAEKQKQAAVEDVKWGLSNAGYSF